MGLWSPYRPTPWFGSFYFYNLFICKCRNDYDKKPAKLTCSEHAGYCEHLDMAFYEGLDGQHRCLLALAVGERNVPGTEPPAV